MPPPIGVNSHFVVKAATEISVAIASAIISLPRVMIILSSDDRDSNLITILPAGDSGC